VKREK